MNPPCWNCDEALEPEDGDDGDEFEDGTVITCKGCQRMNVISVIDEPNGDTTVYADEPDPESA